MSTITYTQTKVHVTEHPPFVCSSCGCQHVDSGTWISGRRGTAPFSRFPESTNKHLVDDLVHLRTVPQGGVCRVGVR
jgi:endogenous inhibitor of DNA gyrase (YacG/DUF329 family)